MGIGVYDINRERCLVGSRDEGPFIIPNLGRRDGSLAEIWGRGERREEKRGRGGEVDQLTSRHWYPFPSEFHALAHTGRRVTIRSGGRSHTDSLTLSSNRTPILLPHDNSEKCHG